MPDQVSASTRFEFGKNWQHFLSTLTAAQIKKAKLSLQDMLETDSLAGKNFLDAGSGSGLFSLVAMELGAKQVVSFDYDPQSVACAKELKHRYFPGAENWTIESGDVLDSVNLETLGEFDIVYSWGVLHHTGNMWQALDNVASCVGSRGKLFISIYNDQGYQSKLWFKVKKAYNRLPQGLRFIILCPCFFRLWSPTFLKDIFRRGNPLFTWNNYKKNRGMSAWRDVVDWVGGVPFEVAKPEEIFKFYKNRGFTLWKLKTVGGGHGCNEFVFQKQK